MRLVRAVPGLCVLLAVLLSVQACSARQEPGSAGQRNELAAFPGEALRDALADEVRPRDQARPQVVPREPSRPPIEIPDLASGPKVTNLGPASLVTATMVGGQVGDLVYAASNGVSPVVVGAYDPGSRRVVRTYRLPTGTGAWAMAHIGTDLYVGVYGPAHLYRIDTVDGTVTRVAEMGSWIWSLAASPDGKIFAGTYPKGEIYAFDPATGETNNLGAAVPGEKYVRSIAVSDTTIYAGVGTDAHLIALDRRTGEKEDLLPGRFADSTFVNALSLSPDGRTLAAGLTPSGPVLVFDRGPGAGSSGPVEVGIGDGDFASALQVGADGDVYLGARPSGTLYRYHRRTGELEALGTPYRGATAYRILAGPEAVRAIVESGIVEYDRDSGELGTVALAQAGLEPRPELPMAIASLGGGRLLVSGKFGVQVHDLRTGSTWRLRVPGEAKAITPVPSGVPSWGRSPDRPGGATGSRTGGETDGETDQVFLSLYSGARVLGLDVGTGTLVPLHATGHQQTRPTDAVYAPEQKALLVATEPDYGRRNGTLSIRELDGGEVKTYRGVIPQQSVRSVAVDGDIAYLGGSIRNGLGTKATAETASLTAFSMRTRTVLWRAAPIPGAEAITDLAVYGGRIYGTTRDGSLFEFEPDRQQLLSVQRPGTDRGTLVVAGGRLYGTDGDRLYRVEPRRSEPPDVRTVVDGLDARWYGSSPLLAADPGGKAVYALQHRDLVRIRLPPP